MFLHAVISNLNRFLYQNTTHQVVLTIPYENHLELLILPVGKHQMNHYLTFQRLANGVKNH